MDRYRISIGIVVGVLVALPVVYFGVIDHPTGTREPFLAEPAQPSDLLSEPYRVNATFNDRSIVRATVDPVHGRSIRYSNLRYEPFANETVYDDGNRSCYRYQFENATRFHDGAPTILDWAGSAENVRFRNATRTMYRWENDSNGGNYSVDLLIGGFSNVGWERAGETTYGGRRVRRYRARNSWGYYIEPGQFYDDVNGTLFVHPKTELVYAGTVSARVEDVDNRVEALLVDDGFRLSIRYRVEPGVSPPTEPEWVEYCS